MPTAIATLLAGGTTGFLAGMLGAGGGFATVTLLLILGLDNETAVGTSLVFTVLVGAWGTVVHLRQRTASAWLAIALGVPSAISAFFAANLTLSEVAFDLSFAALAALAILALVADARRRPQGPSIEGAQHVAGRASFSLPDRRTMVGAMAGGALIGVLKGVFGVGGGFLLVPFMVVALRVPERIAVGSSLFAILLGSIAGGARHAMLGNVSGETLLWLLPGGLIGSLVGARVVHHASGRFLRLSFVSLLAVTGVYLIGRAAL